MRRLSYLLLLPLLLLSCAKEEPGWDGPVIELTLDMADDLETRAGYNGTQDGVDRYNENLIAWVDFFFYPGNALDGDATYHVRRTSGKRRSDVMRLEMTNVQVNTLIFPSSPDDVSTAKVFAVVNYPDVMVEDETDLSHTSLAELKALTVQTDFVSPANHRQQRFMMSGEANLSLRGRTQVVASSATINLTRYACKLTIGVKVADEVEVGTEVWEPMLSGMEVYLVNGVDDVTLGGEQPASPHYFSYKDNAMRFAYLDTQDQLHLYFEKDEQYYQTYPTYMYPQRWEYGSTESPRKEPFIKLVVPWVRRADAEHPLSTQKQFYYKIVMPDDRRDAYKRTFQRNNWYHVDINVGILGSETDDAMVKVLNGSCYIVYWQDKEVVIKNAEIGTARYLSLDRNEYEFRNIDEVEIPYTTSHPVRIKDIRATRPYYGEKTKDNNGNWLNTLGGTVGQAADGSYYLNYNPSQRLARNDGKEWVVDTGTSIRLQHTLNNDYESTYFDYSPYTITFTLVHDDRPDDTNFMQEVTIIQYPAIYIQALKNRDTQSTSGHPVNYGYCFVDGQERRTRAEYTAKAEIYKSQGHTWNLNDGGTVRWIPEMQDLQWRLLYYSGGSTDIFKMNITVLPGDSDFVIGDPRKDQIDNLSGYADAFDEVPTFALAPAIEGGERTLTYYYPTDATDRTRNMMAPEYRIASKFGGIEYYNGTKMTEALYRCATFQEDGFPAGRWRLPTRGEIRFIAMLSKNEAFAKLFSVGSYYWSANGALKVEKADVSDAPDQPAALTRCVYDTWYWGDEQLPDNTVFTWGDQPR